MNRTNPQDIQILSSYPLPECPVKKSLRILRDFFLTLVEKITDLWIRFLKERATVYHYGGESVCICADPGKNAIRIHPSYFYEKIPLRTDSGQTFFLYKNQIKKLNAQWRKEIKAGTTEKTFQVWLVPKTKEPSFQKLIDAHPVRYFSDRDREQTQVLVDRKGRLTQVGLDSKGSKPTLMEGKFIFVYIEFTNKQGKKEKKLFASPKTKTENGKVQHSSFCRGNRVTAAGVMIIDSNGKIKITNESGHYRPSKSTCNTVAQYLENDLGIDPEKIEKKILRFKIYG